MSAVDRDDPDEPADIGDRAVVVGGSIAGLTPARGLAEGFDDAVVVDRDPFPDGPVARDGAPQTSHPDALLEADPEPLSR
jgi:glycine/D-amino acid oxidase-like deaminating enzyme